MAEGRFDFVKSADCREIVIDGVYGGPGPRGRINAVLYVERNHIPPCVTHVIGDDGLPGEENLAKREVKDGTVRVIETIVLMDVTAAKALHKFLGEQIGNVTA